MKRYNTFEEFYEKIKDSGDPVKVIKEHANLFREYGIKRAVYYIGKCIESLD